MPSRLLLSLLLPALLLAVVAPAQEENVPALGIRLEHYDYPFRVAIHAFESQRQPLEMAYMDVNPQQPNGRTVVLLHGKNFMGAYWERTARDLTTQGYQVVIPDQIGFGKSSKPEFYHYTFHQLAANTRELLESLGVEKATIVEHSMGGMLAVRFALMYPEMTERLVLVNPIGLEDWQTKGVPYRPVDQWFEREKEQSFSGIQKYQKESYYAGDWNENYAEWARVLAGMHASDADHLFAWNQALTYDMIFTQPVVHEFPRIAAPTLLIIGQRDRTALGKDTVDEEMRRTLGNYPELGRTAAEAIPNAHLVELDDVGHLPHIEAYDRFLEPLLNFLENDVSGAMEETGSITSKPRSMTRAVPHRDDVK